MYDELDFGGDVVGQIDGNSRLRGFVIPVLVCPSDNHDGTWPGHGRAISNYAGRTRLSPKLIIKAQSGLESFPFHAPRSVIRKTGSIPFWIQVFLWETVGSPQFPLSRPTRRRFLMRQRPA